MATEMRWDKNKCSLSSPLRTEIRRLKSSCPIIIISSSSSSSSSSNIIINMNIDIDISY